MPAPRPPGAPRCPASEMAPPSPSASATSSARALATPARALARPQAGHDQAITSIVEPLSVLEPVAPVLSERATELARHDDGDVVHAGPRSWLKAPGTFPSPARSSCMAPAAVIPQLVWEVPSVPASVADASRPTQRVTVRPGWTPPWRAGVDPSLETSTCGDGASRPTLDDWLQLGLPTTPAEARLSRARARGPGPRPAPGSGARRYQPQRRRRTVTTRPKMVTSAGSSSMGVKLGFDGTRTTFEPLRV